MLWLTITISAYFILAVVYLFDKYLLKGSIPNPKVFAFYVGILGGLSFILIPFIGFYIPGIKQIIISLLAGLSFIYGLFWFYKALYSFETSRVVPAIGGLVPFFSFGLIYIFSFGKANLSLSGNIAFIFLILGSVLVTIKKEKFISLKSFKISAIAAFLFALSTVLVKYVYLSQPFWNGFIWTKVGGFLMAVIFFLFGPEIKEEIFKRKISFKKKTAGLFLSSQVAGSGANIMQNWAIALAPLAYVAVINALQGVQYVFLFIFTIFLSLKFPEILKEEISKKIILQKVLAILLIGIGLVLLVYK